MAELLSQLTDQPISRQDSSYSRSRCQISVIVPVGPEDDTWKSLLPCFSCLADDAEICFVGTGPMPAHLPALLERHGVNADAQWVESPPGRATQMNRGARHVKGEFFWFLHADSQFEASAFTKLLAAIDAHPEALHYFDLVFKRRTVDWIILNEWGVRLRSRVLGLPFGDQGLCLHRRLFNALGPFDEQVAYGEDHLLVWRSHCRGIRVRPIRATLSTSARKYHERGWVQTTALHGWRTWRQALPELWRHLKGRRR